MSAKSQTARVGKFAPVHLLLFCCFSGILSYYIYSHCLTFLYLQTILSLSLSPSLSLSLSLSLPLSLSPSLSLSLSLSLPLSLSLSVRIYHRRGARRWKKIRRINGHAFVAKRFQVSPCPLLILICFLFLSAICTCHPPSF